MKWLRNVSFIFSPFLVAVILSYLLLRFTYIKSVLIVVIILSALVLSIINAVIIIVQISK